MSDVRFYLESLDVIARKVGALVNLSAHPDVPALVDELVAGLTQLQQQYADMRNENTSVREELRLAKAQAIAPPQAVDAFEQKLAVLRHDCLELTEINRVLRERLLESNTRADAKATRADTNANRADENATRADANASRADANARRADENAARADANALRADKNAARADENAARADAIALHSDNLSTAFALQMKPPAPAPASPDGASPSQPRKPKPHGSDAFSH